MADYDYDASVSRYDSWVSFYAAKAREPAGALQLLMKSKLLILDPLPSDYANGTDKFKTIPTAYPQWELPYHPSRRPPTTLGS
jgi:hypothetical protein